MKQLLLSVAVAIACTSCTKNVTNYYNSDDPNRIDTAMQYASFSDVTGVSKFTVDSVPGINPYYFTYTPYNSWDSIQINAFNTIAALDLESSPTTTVYLASTTGQMSAGEAETYFAARGYAMCSYAQAGGLIKKYSPGLQGINFICSNLPTKIDFKNGAGPQEAIAYFSAGYTVSVTFYQKSNSSFNAQYLICKK